MDSLYCNEEEEEKLGDDLADSMPAVDLIISNETTTVNYSFSSSTIPENEQEQEMNLLSLLSKEKETHNSAAAIETAGEEDSRREAVEWIIKVNGYYGFSTLTAIMAVNYLDRFIASVHFQTKASSSSSWVIHLASVSSLSLAAKFEEINLPLLLDFQVESKYVFEAKAIEKMEVLMLSTLKWRMNIVTPLSFLEHIIIRLGFNNNNNGGGGHWDFLRRFERLLLSVVVDSRMVRYEASVLATCIMLHVIHEIEQCNDAVDECYHNQLFHLFNICKMKVKECSEVISEIVSSPSSSSSSKKSNSNDDVVVLGHHISPTDALLATTSDADADADADVSSSSNDSWAVSSPLKKKIRIQEQQMRLPSLPLNNRRLFLELVGSPH